MNAQIIKFAKCSRCGVDFEIFYTKRPFKLCRECRKKHRKEKVMRGKQNKRVCETCGCKFKGTISHKYCSYECRMLRRKFTGYYKVRFAVLYRDDFRCQYCGATPQDGAKLHIDHIVPRSKGGTDDVVNLITSCSVCNIGKKDLILDKNPTVCISTKTRKILSAEILNRQHLKDLGISNVVIQMMLNLN